MSNEKELSPQASLQLIEGMLNQAKNRFSDNSFLYLLWGWVIFFSAIGHFLLLQVNWMEHPEMIWMSTWVAVIIQIIVLAKQKKKETVKTYADEIISYIWSAFGVSGFCTMFIIVGWKSQMNWSVSYSLILMLYGIPTFLSGAVMRFKPLIIGGICCWALSIASTFVPTLYVLLLLAVAVVSAWIIPGYLLKAKYKSQSL
jgi:uncharacterized membrane protein